MKITIAPSSGFRVLAKKKPPIEPGYNGQELLQPTGPLGEIAARLGPAAVAQARAALAGVPAVEGEDQPLSTGRQRTRPKAKQPRRPAPKPAAKRKATTRSFRRVEPRPARVISIVRPIGTDEVFAIEGDHIESGSLGVING